MKIYKTNSESERIEAFTISSFTGIPLCTKLFEQFFWKFNSNANIVVHQCSIKGNVNYSSKIENNPIKSFSSFELFKEQTAFFKVRKYLQIILRILKFILSAKNPIIYVIDLNTCTISLVLKKIFFFKKIKVIYHQFEMDIPESKTKLDYLFFTIFKRMSLRLDLFIVPELNRLRYFCEKVKLDKNNYLLFPNTTNKVDSCKKCNETIVFAHVGGLDEGYYIENFLIAFSKLTFKAELLLIGRVSSEIHLMISKYSLTNVQIIGHVQHDMLGEYYSKIDYGLILYRPISLNNDYCAPNKLYEFWANGIPVIAHKLKGLIEIFDRPYLGKLINMDDADQFEQSINQCDFGYLKSSNSQLKSHFDSELCIDKYFTKLESKIENF